MSHDALKQQLADALGMMEQAGVIDFNGHMSCRLPGTEHLLINSGRSVRSALTAADIIAIDLDGKPVDGAETPPMEFPLHTEIYRRRPDVNAIAHTHPLWSTLFGMVGERVQPVTMQAAVMGPIQFFDKTASINQKGLAEELAAAEVETIGTNLRRPNLFKKVWDYHHAKLRPVAENPREGGGPMQI